MCVLAVEVCRNHCVLMLLALSCSPLLLSLSLSLLSLCVRAPARQPLHSPAVASLCRARGGRRRALDYPGFTRVDRELPHIFHLLFSLLVLIVNNNYYYLFPSGLFLNQ